MATEKRGKDLLIGAVVGGVLGAATALLFAPKSGRELRKDIAEQAQTVSEKTVQIAGTVSSKSQEFVQTARTQTSDLVEKAKDAASSLVEGVRSLTGSKKSESFEDEPEEPEAAEDLVILGNR